MYNGGLPVLGYYLQSNDGYDTEFTSAPINVLVNETSYTFTNLITGANYKFRIAAYNLILA